MKRVFSSIHGFVHLWAHQTQDQANCANASFSGRTFRSYSTDIAEIQSNARGEQLVLMDERGYSSTTRKHKSAIRNATSHMLVIEVPYIHAQYKPDANYNYFARQHAEAFDKIARARENISCRLRDTQAIITDMRKYALFFDLTWEIPDDINMALYADRIDDVARRVAETAIRREEKYKRDHAESIERQKVELEKWVAGDTNTHYSYYNELKLRIKGDEIQTSRGANIPIEHAVKIWPMLHKAHLSGKSIIPSPERTIHLGHYRFNGFEDDTLIVGCHRIPYVEIERTAHQLGLLELA